MSRTSLRNPFSRAANVGLARRRSGDTLLEMMVALIAGTILVVGLASSLFLAGRAMDEAAKEA